MRRFGTFELGARLGRGGSAEVWRAVHRGAHGFARTVALKRLLPERLADERLRTSLLNEARLAARLTHANIAQVLEVVEAGGEHAIVMELVDGCDLRTLLKAMAPLGPPSPGFGAFVAHEVCRALGAAHGERPPILHRDVSTTNVLIARTGAVKLADFGIGKALDAASSDGTAAGIVRGNLGYMAPEQLARAPVSPATDVYAAGVLLWELLTGRRLFGSAFDLSASAESRQRPILPPSSLSPTVPAALDAICARAMSLSPADRWSDGASMARALEPHALGFGPTQLSALMRDFAPPPVEDEPARHTMTVAGATATVVDPPRPAPPRRARFALAAALGAAAGLAAFTAWPRSVAEIAPPPRTPPIASPTPLPQQSIAPRAPSPPVSPPLMKQPDRKHAAARPTTPDLVEGKLLNPFKH
jgi:serine/threonine protein kinase